MTLVHGMENVFMVGEHIFMVHLICDGDTGIFMVNMVCDLRYMLMLYIWCLMEREHIIMVHQVCDKDTYDIYWVHLVSDGDTRCS